jgi:hypothetical protein
MPDQNVPDPVRLADLEACLYRLTAIVDLLVDNQQMIADRLVKARGGAAARRPAGRPPCRPAALRVLPGGAS